MAHRINDTETGALMFEALPTLPAPGACNSIACNAAMVMDCGIGESDEAWHCRWVYNNKGYV